MLVWKDDCLAPGRWVLRDGRVFECRAQDIPHFADNLKAMIRHGLWVPGCWEHMKRARPVLMSTADWEELFSNVSRHTFGHAKDVRVDPRTKSIAVAFDIEDPADAAQLRKTKGISPYIEPNSYIDPTGRVWPPYCILHLAATPTPIAIEQRPFGRQSELAGIGMSGARQFASAVRVGLAFARRQSDTAICLSGAVPLEKDMPDPKNPADDNEPVEVPTDDAPPETPPEPAAEPPAGDANAAKLPEVLQVLQSVGLHMSKDTTIDNLLDQIVAAGKTKAAHDATDANVEDEDLEDEDEIPDENQPGSQPASPPSPILMSQQVVSLQGENTDLRSRLARERRVQISAQIRKLAKRLGPKVISRLEAELRTTHDDQLVAPISLSSVTAGNAIPVLKQIDVLEEASRGRRFVPVKMSSAAETISAPAGPGGTDPQDKTDAAAKANGRAMGEFYLGKRTK